MFAWRKNDADDEGTSTKARDGTCHRSKHPYSSNFLEPRLKFLQFTLHFFTTHRSKTHEKKMAVSIAIWSQVLTPGGRVRVIPGSDFRLTTATFGEDIVDEKGRTTIKLYRLAMPEDSEDEEDDEDEEDEEKELTFEKDPVVIGHLIPGKVGVVLV